MTADDDLDRASVARLSDHYRIESRERAAMTGYHGTAIGDIPEGWVSVTDFPTPGSAHSNTWTGPILEETDTAIRIEVWLEPLTFPKHGTIIRRTGEDQHTHPIAVEHDGVTTFPGATS